MNTQNKLPAQNTMSRKPRLAMKHRTANTGDQGSCGRERTLHVSHGSQLSLLQALVVSPSPLWRVATTTVTTTAMTLLGATDGISGRRCGAGGCSGRRHGLLHSAPCCGHGQSRVERVIAEVDHGAHQLLLLLLLLRFRGRVPRKINDTTGPAVTTTTTTILRGPDREKHNREVHDTP
jgi:hypothetical protein